MVRRIDRDANPRHIRYSNARPAWMSRPHPALIASSLVALGAALILVVSPLAASLGFVPMPGTLAITIVVIVATYLVCAEIAKRAADRPGGKP